MGKIKRTRLEKNVFRRANRRGNSSKLRQSLESILMLTLGISLLFFLNTLPSKYDIYKLSTIQKKLLDIIQKIGEVRTLNIKDESI